jgi:hypothetical protein
MAAQQPIRMELLPAEGNGFELNLPDTLMHALCKMMKQAATEAEWGLELEMPGSGQTAPPAYLLN